jgi:hypothetical protein
MNRTFLAMALLASTVGAAYAQSGGGPGGGSAGGSAGLSGSGGGASDGASTSGGTILAQIVG